MSTSKSPPIANRLLASLPKKDFEELERHLEEVPLVFEEFLYKPNVLISDVYFPNSGIISLLAGTNERSVQAMQNLERRLVRRDDRLIQLLDPPFDKSELNPGYIKGYVPGVRENGGQYTMPRSGP